LLSIDLTDYLTEQNHRRVQKTVRFILTIFSLFLSSISGYSGQLLFILRPAGQPFSRPSSHVVKYAPKGRPQHVCIDSRNVFHMTKTVPFKFINMKTSFNTICLVRMMDHIDGILRTPEETLEDVCTIIWTTHRIEGDIRRSRCPRAMDSRHWKSDSG
jgi:hypothetical protein